jgi:hypothetical protein
LACESSAIFVSRAFSLNSFFMAVVFRVCGLFHVFSVLARHRRTGLAFRGLCTNSQGFPERRQRQIEYKVGVVQAKS